MKVITRLPPVVKDRHLESVSDPFQCLMVTVFSSNKHITETVSEKTQHSVTTSLT